MMMPTRKQLQLVERPSSKVPEARVKYPVGNLPVPATKVKEIVPVSSLTDTVQVTTTNVPRA